MHPSICTHTHTHTTQTHAHPHTHTHTHVSRTHTHSVSQPARIWRLRMAASTSGRKCSPVRRTSKTWPPSKQGMPSTAARRSPRLSALRYAVPCHPMGPCTLVTRPPHSPLWYISTIGSSVCHGIRWPIIYLAKLTPHADRSDSPTCKPT